MTFTFLQCAPVPKKKWHLPKKNFLTKVVQYKITQTIYKTKFFISNAFFCIVLRIFLLHMFFCIYLLLHLFSFFFQMCIIIYLEVYSKSWTLFLSQIQVTTLQHMLCFYTLFNYICPISNIKIVGCISQCLE